MPQGTSVQFFEILQSSTLHLREYRSLAFFVVYSGQTLDGLIHHYSITSPTIGFSATMRKCLWRNASIGAGLEHHFDFSRQSVS
jgi:hypothetical protein